MCCLVRWVEVRMCCVVKVRMCCVVKVRMCCVVKVGGSADVLPGKVGGS